MRFDERYKTKLALYRRGRCDGPSTYTFKKDGLRLHYLGGAARVCFFCGKRTAWGMTYFYPDERFKDWKKRNVSSFHICEEEEIPLLKAQVIENKINNQNTMQFTPRTREVKEALSTLKGK